MLPNGERTQKEKAIEKGVDAALEHAVKPVTEVIVHIENRLNTPVNQATDAVGELTTLQQLWAIQKKYAKEMTPRKVKELVNMGITVLSLLPVLGTLSTDLVDAAILEGATPQVAQALATGATVTAGGEVAYPLAHIVGKKGAEKLGKVLHALNPFEDIPPELVAICGTVGLAVPGFGAVPAGVEIAILNMKDIKSSVLHAKEMGGVLLQSPEFQSVKSFGRAVVDSVSARIHRAATPQMQEARAVFAM